MVAGSTVASDHARGCRRHKEAIKKKTKEHTLHNSAAGLGTTKARRMSNLAASQAFSKRSYAIWSCGPEGS